jgi:hypothetical protein
VVQKLYNVLEAVDQDPNWWVDWNVIESVWE